MVEKAAGGSWDGGETKLVVLLAFGGRVQRVSPLRQRAANYCMDGPAEMAGRT